MYRALARVPTGGFTGDIWRSWKQAVSTLHADAREAVSFITSLPEEEILSKADDGLRSDLEQDFIDLFEQYTTHKSPDSLQAYFGMQGYDRQTLLSLIDPARVAPMLITPVLEQARRRAIFMLLQPTIE